MVSVSYSDLLTVLDKTTQRITTAETEAIINLAIDLLNLFGADLSRMSGTSGSKTVSLDSEERGAVLFVARDIYHSFFENPTSASAGGVTLTALDIMDNPFFMSRITRIARRLIKPKGRSG